jgi:hypothetical protein
LDVYFRLERMYVHRGPARILTNRSTLTQSWRRRSLGFPLHHVRSYAHQSLDDADPCGLAFANAVQQPALLSVYRRLTSFLSSSSTEHNRSTDTSATPQAHTPPTLPPEPACLVDRVRVPATMRIRRSTDIRSDEPEPLRLYPNFTDKAVVLTMAKMSQAAYWTKAERWQGWLQESQWRPVPSGGSELKSYVFHQEEAGVVVVAFKGTDAVDPSSPNSWICNDHPQCVSDVLADREMFECCPPQLSSPGPLKYVDPV